MLAARCVFLARMPIIIFVLVYRVVGCAILILVPMSVSHIMMLGFTLLPRTFAGYACCRLLKYVSYGETSIVDDWVGLHSL